MESEVKAARREKILDAAERLFRQQGFRATSMEGIAAEVRMSKATVYAYYRDKDTLFTAVTQRLVNQIKSAMQEAFACDGTAHELITNALVAKYEVIFSRVRSSAHSSELVAARDTVLKELFDELDRDTLRMMGLCLRNGGMTKRTAESIARILLAATQGIAKKADSLNDFTKAMRVLSAALVNGQDSVREPARTDS